MSNFVKLQPDLNVALFLFLLKKKKAGVEGGKVAKINKLK